MTTVVGTQYTSCPKCGFVVALGRRFNVKYEDRCIYSCTWRDEDIREHLHVLCPDCGYQVGVQGCLDYKERKEKSAPKPWTGIGTLSNKATTPIIKFVGGRGYVDAPAHAPDTGWSTECPECPMSKEPNA